MDKEHLLEQHIHYFSDDSKLSYNSPDLTENSGEESPLHDAGRDYPDASDAPPHDEGRSLNESRETPLQHEGANPAEEETEYHPEVEEDEVVEKEDPAQKRKEFRSILFPLLHHFYI